MNESFPNNNIERLPHIGLLRTGEPVFDRPNSHILNKVNIQEYLPRALSEISPEGREFLVETVDLGEIIGRSICVETTEADEIVYAQRPRRSGRTRFVLNREPDPTSEITVVLKQIPTGYILISAYLGPKAEPEPWDRNATPESQHFWDTHALVWGQEEVIPKSATRKIE